MHVVVSSHILHEVDLVSDHVVLLSHGYVVAEGQIHGVRSEVTEQPMQILVRCDRPHRAGRGPLREPTTWSRSGAPPRRQGGLLGAHARRRRLPPPAQPRSSWRPALELEAVSPADDDVGAVYQYLIGSDTEVV